MIKDYQRLPELLQLQREALAKQDAAALEAIGAEIGDLSQRIVHHALSFDRLEDETRVQLKAVIKQAQTEVELNLKMWNESIDGLHGARNQLQASRRYCASLQGPGKAGLRYSRSG